MTEIEMDCRYRFELLNENNRDSDRVFNDDNVVLLNDRKTINDSRYKSIVSNKKNDNMD